MTVVYKALSSSHTDISLSKAKANELSYGYYFSHCFSSKINNRACASIDAAKEDAIMRLTAF